MACFVVPAGEAVVTTVVEKIIKKKEKKSGENNSAETIPFSRKLKWLNNMLWGGSALLAFEHVWHGEIIPWFPFLTAAANPADTAEMLHEMAVSGTAMALLVTVIWAGIAGAATVIGKRSAAPKIAVNGGMK